LADPIREPDREYKGAEHPIRKLDQEYKMGGALPVKYSEYFGAKRHESLKNENIRYDIWAKHYKVFKV
jgi:hypothetical protein